MTKKIRNVCSNVAECTYNNERFMTGFKNCLIVLAYVIIAVALMSNFGFAADDPDIFDEASSIINDIQGKLVALSGGAVIIAVACGVFMKKFSMGKQDKIELGNKLIRDSIIGFAVLNSMVPIINFIRKYAKGTTIDVSKESFLNMAHFFQNLL